MILLVAVALGVMVGWLVGGRLRNLGRLQMRGESALVAVVFATALLPRALDSAPSRWHPALIVVWSVMMAVVIWLCLLNLRTPGALLLGVGVFANCVAVLLNGGMPVSKEAVLMAGGGPQSISKLAGDAFHINASGSRVSWLGDVLGVPGLRVVVSAGDILILLGVVVLIAWAMRLRSPNPGLMAR